MEHVQPLHEQIHLQKLVRAFCKAPVKRRGNLVSQRWHPESPVSVWMKQQMPQQVERKIWAHHAVTIVRIETVSPPALAACCLWREFGCLPLSNTMIPSRSSQNQSP